MLNSGMKTSTMTMVHILPGAQDSSASPLICPDCVRRAVEWGAE